MTKKNKYTYIKNIQNTKKKISATIQYYIYIAYYIYVN